MRNLLAKLRKPAQDNLGDLSAAEIMIGSGVLASGTLTTDRDIYIDGQFRGDIKTKGYAKIGPNARVIGSISCRSARVNGVLKGELSAVSEILVEGGARIIAKLNAHQIQIDKGASLQAECKTKGQ